MAKNKLRPVTTLRGAEEAEEDLDAEKRDKRARDALREIDAKYLDIAGDEEDQLARAYNKQKQTKDKESYQPLQSIFIRPISSLPQQEGEEVSETRQLNESDRDNQTVFAPNEEVKHDFRSP